MMSKSELMRQPRPDDGHRSPVSRAAERAELQQQLDQWLSQGGQIQKVPTGQSGYRGGRCNVSIATQGDTSITRDRRDRK